MSIAAAQNCHRRQCAGIFTIVMMALLPSPMPRRLAVVDDDGDGMMGNDDDDNFDDATDFFAVVAMALLPSLQWHCYRHRCAGIVPLLVMLDGRQP